MSIGAGALALKRIQVLQDTRSTPLAWILEKLKAHLVSPIGMDESREQTLGWCHPYSGEPDMANAQAHVYGNAFVFGMRADSKRIPGTLFRLQMKAALESIGRGVSDESVQNEGGKGRRRVSKKIKDAARDRIRLELLKRTLPNIRLVEVVWHLDSNEIWLTSGSNAVIADFEKLFTESFGLPFVHVNPGTATVDFDRLLSGLNVSLQPLLDVVPVGLLRGRETDPSQRPLQHEVQHPRAEDLSARGKSVAKVVEADEASPYF